MKTKDILWWIVAILILAFATMFFGSCGESYAEIQEKNRDSTNVIIWSNVADVYTFVDDGCTFITGYHGGFIHHPTCNNPKHSCICYNEVYE